MSSPASPGGTSANVASSMMRTLFVLTALPMVPAGLLPLTGDMVTPPHVSVAP